MQSDTDKLVRNLSVVGQLQPNDKLLTTGEFFEIYAPSTWREVYRFVLRERREQNIDRVAETVRAAKTCVTNLLANVAPTTQPTTVLMHVQQSLEQQLCLRMMDKLGAAIAGLDNVALTYANDASTRSKIENLKADIAEFLQSTSTVARYESLR